MSINLQKKIQKLKVKQPPQPNINNYRPQEENSTFRKYPNPGKYPLVLILHKPEYKQIQEFLIANYGQVDFGFELVNYDTTRDDFQEFIEREMNKMFCPDYSVLLTFGDSWNEYNISDYLVPRIQKKWIHIKPEELSTYTIQHVNQMVMNVLLNYLPLRQENRPKISCFTTSYKSYDKILRVFNSLQKQTYKDWEWIIIDDSDDDNHFKFLKENVSSKDYRIRLFRRDYNSGNIGWGKNEAVALCWGEIVSELDHDDELPHLTTTMTVVAFEKYPEVGFVYMNFAECYSDYRPFTYGNGWAFGYGGYYTQQYDGHEFQVATSVDINDVTMSNIVGVPNHPRVWRKSVLMELGNYSEYLHIADDYELLLLTCLKTKMLKINQLGYIQFKNDGNSNFSLIRNREITKLQNQISHNYYQRFNIREFFKEHGVTEHIKRENNCINITIDTSLD